MAQNVTINGTTYNAVPAVQIPKSGGGTATFTDVSDTTAVAADVNSGKYIYLANGSKVQGSQNVYSITGNYTQVTSKNSSSRILGGTSYVSEIKPTDGYLITSVMVTMGGVDITSQVFSGESGSGGGGGITPTGTISITENGTVNVTNYASANVNVSNSYSSSDEGKVVSNGALVAQGSDTVTSNGTYDTTLINSLIVSVATSGAQYKTGTYTPTATTTSTNNTAITTTQTIGFTPKVFILAVNNKSNIQGMGTVMVCTAFCTVGASSDNIRYTGRYSNTSNSFGGTMYIGAWTTQQGNALYFNSNTIYFRASTNYRLIKNVEYVWYAYG